MLTSSLGSHLGIRGALPWVGVPDAHPGPPLLHVKGSWVKAPQPSPGSPWLMENSPRLKESLAEERGGQRGCCAGAQLHAPHIRESQPLPSDPVNSC